MISSNDFKKGTAIKVDGNLFMVVDFQHVKPGKGGAFVRTKLKNLNKGTVIDKTFRAGEKVEDIRVENRP
ncbi:MAG TPA: elongation factor P, partial [Spirochaetota bacterium]|nr:elongation factor P [Spirochaetota bacterium]